MSRLWQLKLLMLCNGRKNYIFIVENGYKLYTGNKKANPKICFFNEHIDGLLVIKVAISGFILLQRSIKNQNGFTISFNHALFFKCF